MGILCGKMERSDSKVADEFEVEQSHKMRMARRSISKNWREFSGEHYWKNLLEPLDINLRRYIIHYGEMAEATYDAFDSDKRTSKYEKKDFFSKVGLEKGNPFKYEVTKFLYATSEIDFKILDDIEESNWIGYVAVATDEGKAALGRRDIVIAWRGTTQIMEWVKDLELLLDDAPYIFGPQGDCKVHHGFYSVYTASNESATFNKSNVRTQVLNEIKRLVEKYREEEISITVTGHSLGAALATLNAVDIVANGYNIRQDESQKACPVTAIVFASPRVGNSSFKEFFDGQKDLRALRIRNKDDIVPRVPFIGYSEVGQELEIDSMESEFLKHPGDLKTWHNLEAYLHGMAGTQGSKGGFKLEVERDIALVNKSLDALKNKYHIPASWMEKGLVRQIDGSWKKQDPETEDDDDSVNDNTVYN